MPTRRKTTKTPKTEGADASDAAPALFARNAKDDAEVKAAPKTESDAPQKAAAVPVTTSLKVVREAAKACLVCPWAARSTQTVFGEGPTDARLMLVGEQPGDQEDRAGHPFVGPSGEVLAEALEEAGIDRKEIFVTNAVKHFKFEPRGKRRIHQTPTARDSSACRPWLEAELRLVKPQVLLCLGATAARSLYGASFRITQQRGEVFASDWCERSMATYHPSAILRVPDPRASQQMREAFRADIRAAKELLKHA